jgi:putative transposase
MPRTARASVGGLCYHIINRGNGRKEVFHKPADYEAFVGLLQKACARIPMRVLGYCLMPNHFHLVVWPHVDGNLGRWMQWLLTAHVRRYHTHYRSEGHVWQGRFKAFPIQADDHLLMVMRYIERNPVRAGLVLRAEHWAWSSASARQNGAYIGLVCEGPLSWPEPWLAYVNEPLTDAELTRVRQSVNRGTPLGCETWTTSIASQLGLEASLRERGRPRVGREK